MEGYERIMPPITPHPTMSISMVGEGDENSTALLSDDVMVNSADSAMSYV